MFDFGPPPIDSYDLYAMGLRPARCNGCEVAKLKHKLGDKFLLLRRESDWQSVYELDADPERGQAEPLAHEGRPICSRGSFLSIGHSDECYNWQPPR